MYRYDPENNKMYWNDKLIGKIDRTSKTGVEDVKTVKLQPSGTLPLGGTLTNIPIGPVHITPPVPAAPDRIYVLANIVDENKAEVAQEIACLEIDLNERINKAERVLKEEIEESWRTHRVATNQRIQLILKVDDLTKKVADLENRKIDRPSLSPELLDAERYMDDFAEIRKKYRVQRFAQKQRTKRKLERLEKAAQFKKKPNRIPAILVSIGVVLAALAAGLAL